MNCPVCRQPMHRVYFGDEQRWWRCMRCDYVYQIQLHRYENGELVRVWWRRRECTASSAER